MSSRKHIHEAAAEAGALYLDRVLPTWDTLVDVDTLDLKSGCNCVLGQLNIDLYPADLRDPYAAMTWRLDLSNHEVEELGFNLPYPSDWREWDELNQAWRHEIGKRRVAKPARAPQTGNDMVQSNSSWEIDPS